MDVVLQFAIHRLGFQPQDIVIYAWSIGGFTGTCRPARPHLTQILVPAQMWPQLWWLPSGVEAFREKTLEVGKRDPGTH